MSKEDFYFVSGRTEAYTVIELSMFERINSELSISPQDVEVTIFETPKHNWG